MIVKKYHILQVCRLTPLWGIDLFKQISFAYQDHQITTVFLSGPKIPALKTDYHGEVIFLEIDHKKPFWRLKAAMKLFQLFRQYRFDLVICHHYKPTVIVDWIRYFYPRALYFSVHHTLANLRRFGRRVYTYLSMRHGWQFITVSDAVKQDLLDAHAGLCNAQIKTIYNCIVLDEILAQQYPRILARTRLNIAPNAFVFGTIGRLVSAKGHLSFIEAFAQVHHQLPNAILVILGTGPLEATLRAKIHALDLNDKIMILPEHAKQAGYFMQSFDVFVFPSVQEGFGLVLLEAMAAKLPIIASHIGGIPEVLGNTGQLVAPTIEALSQALMNSYQYPDRIAMGIAGYERLCSHFLQEHFKRDFISLFESNSKTLPITEVADF